MFVIARRNFNGNERKHENEKQKSKKNQRKPLFTIIISDKLGIFKNKRFTCHHWNL